MLHVGKGCADLDVVLYYLILCKMDVMGLKSFTFGGVYESSDLSALRISSLGSSGLQANWNL